MHKNTRSQATCLGPAQKDQPWKKFGPHRFNLGKSLVSWAQLYLESYSPYTFRCIKVL